MAQMSEAPGQRPAMVTFAAVMILMLGGFQLVWALTEFANASWIANTAYGTFGGHLWIWGVIDLILAAVTFYAGYDILRGGPFGLIYGVCIAGISAVRWFFMLPVAPLSAVIIILIAALVLYGLLSHSDYFNPGIAP